MHIHITLLVTIAALVKNISGEWVVSSQEAQALEKFSPMVEKYLTQDYMKSDLYLLPFLRNKKLNVQDAKDSLLKTLKWRKEYNIDNVLNEELELEKQMPYSLDGVSKEGNPVLIARAGQWDARRIVLSGKMTEGKRVVHKILEKCSKLTRDLTAMTKKNITQGIAVVDLSGYSIRQHACVQCVPIYIEIVIAFDSYYPQLAKEMILINTPRVFQALFDIVTPVLTDYTRSTLKVFGFDRDEWGAYLNKAISQENPPKFLGGTKAR